MRIYGSVAPGRKFLEDKIAIALGAGVKLKLRRAGF
jgi:hypothetical protein